MAPLSGAKMVYAPVPPFESSVSASPVAFSASTRRENDESAFKVCQIVPAVVAPGYRQRGYGCGSKGGRAKKKRVEQATISAAR